MQHVVITVKGQIDPQWSEWLDNLAITHQGPDQSLLEGEVPDQAALYGILSKLRDLSLALISISVQVKESETEKNQKDRGTES